MEPDFDGIYYYKARWYDPSIMMFNQPDTQVPDPYNPLDWNRYSYGRNNPLRYTDPTGHAVSEGLNQGACDPKRCPGNIRISIPVNTSVPKYSYVPSITPNQGLNWKAVQTPVSNFFAELPGSSKGWAVAGTTSDVIALLFDLYADGVVVYATVAGFSATLPVVVTGNVEVPPLSGGAAFIAADFFLVQPVLQWGNGFAGFATLSTYISETKSGATVIETGQISTPTKNSFTLFVAGLMSREAIGSTVIQTVSVLNDFGIISFPYNKR